MKCYLSTAESQHAPEFFLARGRVQSSPESPQRASVLQQALESSDHQVIIDTPTDGGEDQRAIQAIHDPDYLTFLESAWARWQKLPDATAEIVPNVHPSRNTQYPAPELAAQRSAPYCQSQHVIAQAGYYQADTACPITAGTWQAALSAASAALAAARDIQTSEHRGTPGASYALCRPPGHHAYADQAGGFCYLNNSAIAAQYLRDAGAERVAIVDVDVHHGNGTQGIFYQRQDVLTVSLHGDPAVYYPFFAGYSAETGAGEGAGFNLNVPLAMKTTDDAYIDALDNALKQVVDYSADAIVVALGLDASGDDPLAFLNISTTGFARIGERLGHLNKPTALIQEGGYLSDILGRNLVAFLNGFESTQ